MTDILLNDEKVVIRPIQPNEHAVALMNRFKRRAREQGCDMKKVAQVLEHARSGDYEHLVATIKANSFVLV